VKVTSVGIEIVAPTRSFCYDLCIYHCCKVASNQTTVLYYRDDNHVLSSTQQDLSQEGLVEKKRLNDCAGERNHGKAAMDNLLLLAFRLLFWGKLRQNISSPTDITWCTISVVLVEVGSLNNSNCKQDLKVSRETNRADGAKGIGAGELITREMDACFLNNHTDNSKHADTAMLEFSPSSVVQVGLDIGTASIKKLTS
jgi:hypothetical protein